MTLRRVVSWSVVLVASAASVAVLATRPASVPAFDAVRAAHVPSDAWLLDRHGEVLDSRRVNDGVRRLAWTSLDEVSPALIEAVVDGEDRRFWQHAGVDWRSAAGAVRDGLQGHRRGASTISMQVVKLLDAERQVRTRGVMQKIGQARRALQLERQWSKPQILEAYLNTLQFRGELQGIAATARELAGKTPAGLDADESRILAALLPHPAARPERVAQRACARLADDASRCAELLGTARRLLARGSRAASATDRLAPHLATRLLHAPGESVRTTLDAGLQRQARDALARQLEGLAGRNVRDGAALVIDNATGDVLAYVGSAGPLSTAASVDGVQARRQAGSTLKPFLYGLAIERRYLTAASLLDDSPVSIDTANGLYLPRDYDHQYRGAVSVRSALAGSLNVPAVRTLQLVGVEEFRDRLNALGYSGIDHDGAYYGFALALGSAEVSLWEQAEAFRALALQGRTGPLRVRLDEPLAAQRTVVPAAAAFVIADVLSDRGARAVTFGLDSSLATPYWSAVKTGTSKDMRDNWCVGFTPEHTVVVWVGNFEGDSMRDVSGVSGAAPAWREIMDSLQAGTAAPAPKPPAGVSRHALRFSSAVEPERDEWYLDGTAPGGVTRSVDSHERRLRIGSPVDGMIVALDPDIPVELQRIPIAIEGAMLAGGGAHLLTMDDQQLATAAQPQQLWKPTRGTHRVALLDGSGRIVDHVQFTVR